MKRRLRYSFHLYVCVLSVCAHACVFQHCTHAFSLRIHPLCCPLRVRRLLNACSTCSGLSLPAAWCGTSWRRCWWRRSCRRSFKSCEGSNSTVQDGCVEKQCCVTCSLANAEPLVQLQVVLGRLASCVAVQLGQCTVCVPAVVAAART